MKKTILIICLLIILPFVTVLALKTHFVFKPNKLSFANNSKKTSVLNNFNKSYYLTSSIESQDAKLENKIKLLTKKATYLLLGEFNNKKESSENYYKRKKEFYNLGAYKYYPKDKSTTSGYDETNENYRYAMVSEWAIPLFNKFNEMGIIYNSYGDIRITITNDVIISMITLSNVTLKTQDENNPLEYKKVPANLIIVYYFIKINNDYKIGNLYGEWDDKTSSYINELENVETKNKMAILPSYKTDLSKVYNFSQLEEMTEEDFSNIYNQNINNLVYLNSYYNTSIVSSANGFFISNNLIVTTWDFLEKSLINAQGIIIKNNDGVTYEMIGIVTASPENDIAVIKIKSSNSNYVKLGNYKEIKKEDPAIIISSKTGVAATLQKGIIIANKGYLQSTIPLSNSDEGSPLLNKKGEVIGINTSKSTDFSLSIAINSRVLKEIQDKFKNIKTSDIETIPFQSLKEKYYYTKFSQENVVNNIPKSKWQQFSKIGNIKKNIKLKLVKTSYQNNIISLRYKNDIIKYIDSMQFASEFKDALKTDGYREILNNSSKAIYENNKYKIIIMAEFDYLIVIMVKL